MEKKGYEKYWVSKYALTHGIFSVKARPASGKKAGCIETDELFPNYYARPYWHKKRKDAETRANKMRITKIASLNKRIATIQSGQEPDSIKKQKVDRLLLQIEKLNKQQ